MRRMLLFLGTVVLFLNAVVVPNVARADGPGNGGPPNKCPPGQLCKP